MAVDILGVERNFASLSTKDLLEARDQYHWHLIHKRNVIGTAVGLPHPKERSVAHAGTYNADYRKPDQPKGERTFENPEVRDYSWPCVLVLVEKWIEPDQFGTGEGKLSPEEMVPRTLYMPDGRMVPVCVVKVSRAAPDHQLLSSWTWPDTIIGGVWSAIIRAAGGSLSNACKRGATLA